jgi:hypothetical protein
LNNATIFSVSLHQPFDLRQEPAVDFSEFIFLMEYFAADRNRPNLCRQQEFIFKN